MFSIDLNILIYCGVNIGIAICKFFTVLGEKISEGPCPNFLSLRKEKSLATVALESAFRL